MARILNEKQAAEFFSILGDPPKFTSEVFIDLFAWRKKSNGIRFYVDDIIEIGPAQSKFVKAKSRTTCGCYIINKFLIEPLEVFGYINAVFNKKTFDKIEDHLNTALRDGIVTPEQFAEYIDRSQYLFGGSLAHIVNPSISDTLITLPQPARTLRKKMMDERMDRLDALDPQASAEIEDAVVTEALKDMRTKNDPAMAIFDCGAGADAYNNYRTMFVMKGAVQDNTGESPTGYKIVKSNYDDGVTKEDMPIIADTLVRSSYMSGVATQDSGAKAKTLNNVNQRVALAKRGSFCGTTNTVHVVISEKDVYRYIKVGGKPLALTSENIGKYVGKECEMYTPFGCEEPDPHYCNVCMGDNPYLLGVKNIGLTFNIITGSTMNAALKTKHKTKVELYRITEDDITRYFDFPLR